MKLSELWNLLETSGGSAESAEASSSKESNESVAAKFDDIPDDTKIMVDAGYLKTVLAGFDAHEMLCVASSKVSSSPILMLANMLALPAIATTMKETEDLLKTAR